MPDDKSIPESTKIDRLNVDLVRVWKRQQSAEKTPPPAARHIGVYRVEKRLGKGGMGKVYLAHDDRLGRPVAIKQIRGDKASQTRHRARLRREARAVARLSHPAIAQVHDVVYDEKGYSIVMEYVEGRNVAQLVARGEMNGGLAINVAIQVAQGLAAAHNLDMVHRDLKADNVMVTPAGYAKILDFGLVKKLSTEETMESLTERGLVLGTVVSMSPEQASGRPVDARSDLFSFGVLLYEMFTGYSPFRRQRWLESLEAIRSLRPTPALAMRPELPVELSNLIDWLLQKDPHRRPQNTQLVVDLLARIAATTRVGELPPPNVEVSTDLEPAAESQTSTETFANLDEAAETEVAPSSPGWLARVEGLNFSVVSMVVLVLTAIGLLTWRMASPADSLRILVLRPALSTVGNATGYDRVAAGVAAAARKALGNLEGLVPVSSSRRSAVTSSMEKQARRVGAREILFSKVDCQEDTCVVLFQRIVTSDHSVTGSSGHFEVPIAPDASEVLARTVTAQLHKLYPERLPDSPR